MASGDGVLALWHPRQRVSGYPPTIEKESWDWEEGLGSDIDYSKLCNQLTKHIPIQNPYCTS